MPSRLSQSLHDSFFLGGVTPSGREKRHYHWVLRVPTTTPYGHDRLKHLRDMVVSVINGDRSTRVISQPFRWPGTWHFKKEPRLARILDIAPGDLGIIEDVEEAIAALKPLVPAKPEKPKGVDDRGADVAELIETIKAGLPGTVNDAMWHLAAKLASRGIGEEAIEAVLTAALESSEIDADRRDQRLGQVADIARRAAATAIQAGEGRTSAEHDFDEFLVGLEPPPGAKAEGPKKAPAGTIVFIDFADPASWDPPPMEFVVAGQLPMRCLTSLYGPGGIGKSNLAQMMVVCVSTGRPFFGSPVMQGGVLGFFCEDDNDELMRRQKRICESMGVERSDVAPWVNIQGRVGLDNMLVSYGGAEPKLGAFLAEIRAKVLMLRPRLLILDNIAQLFGGDENLRYQVAHFCNQVSGLMLDVSGAALLLGHPAKSEDSQYSGSTAWDGSVRSRLFLKYADKEDKASGRLILERAKANYAEAAELPLRRINGVLIPDDEASWTPEQRFSVERRVDRAKDVVLRALTKLRELKVKVSSSQHAGASYAPKIILQKGFNEGVPKAELETAMSDLIDAGRVVPVEIGKNEYRKPIMSLAPSGYFSAGKSAGEKSDNSENCLSMTVRLAS
jgi:hypothetical protein